MIFYWKQKLNMLFQYYSYNMVLSKNSTIRKTWNINSLNTFRWEYMQVNNLLLYMWFCMIKKKNVKKKKKYFHCRKCYIVSVYEPKMESSCQNLSGFFTGTAVPAPSLEFTVATWHWIFDVLISDWPYFEDVFCTTFEIKHMQLSPFGRHMQWWSDQLTFGLWLLMVIILY